MLSDKQSQQSGTYLDTEMLLKPNTKNRTTFSYQEKQLSQACMPVLANINKIPYSVDVDLQNSLINSKKKKGPVVVFKLAPPQTQEPVRLDLNL